MSEKPNQFREHAQAIFSGVRPEMRDLTAAALSRGVKRGLMALMMASARKQEPPKDEDDE